MNKTMHWLSIGCFVLLVTAAATFYVGERKLKSQSSAVENSLTAENTGLSGLTADTNRWHVIGLLSATVGAAAGIAALMLWRQDRRADNLTIGVEL
jgi:hypothetical protein